MKEVRVKVVGIVVLRYSPSGRNGRNKNTRNNSIQFNFSSVKSTVASQTAGDTDSTNTQKTKITNSKTQLKQTTNNIYINKTCYSNIKNIGFFFKRH